MTIHIDALTIEVIIGILDFEREKLQRIVIDLEADYAYDNEFIDYSVIEEMISQELKQKRYKLLEDALIGIQSLIISRYPQIKRLWLKISKPDIMERCSVALSDTWNADS